MDRPLLGNVADLASLSKLDETILLDEIKERYNQNKIYTYVGDILIAVNPFKDIGIYNKAYSSKYQNSKRSALPPHIFAVADSAYQALLGLSGRPPCNQCILISGESGAGKTESTKLIIKQVIELCKGNTQLEQQILQVNPLLEAFGNAQTNLNDNSSRFGKYIQLKFNQGQVVGAKISEYLLEKSRVVRQNPGEENFHIFYYLIAGHNDGTFNLKEPHRFSYITNGAQDFSRKLRTLYENYEELVNAMDLVGFTDEEQLDMFSMIASVLHMGNVNFHCNDDDSTSVSDSKGPIQNASEFLGIDTSEVEACLTCMITVTKGEYVKRNYTVQQAADARDAMSKSVYGRLFGWIVNKVNCLLAPENQRNSPLSEIGILDIFGFEDFIKSGGTNSFEQACINLANEQLQFFFNQHIFKMEQEEYQKEGIDWKEINFVDNKPLLDLFLGKPIGLLSLLDEESLFPKGSDHSYVEKLNMAMKGNQYYLKSQQTNKATFSINHYAGKVTYDVYNWLEKNRDTLPPGITELLQSSKNELVKTIFRGQITRTGSLALQGRRTTSRKSKMVKNLPNVANVRSDTDAAKRKLTVGGQFKNSLKILMERMTASTPIFVRCLKPNHQKQPGQLDCQYVLAQLLYTGMLETIEIRRKGFAVRPTFAEFVQNYKILKDLRLDDTKQSCTKILESARLSGWHVGKTKVFLNYAHIEQLKDMLDKMGQSAVHLQRVARGFLARQERKRRFGQAEKEKQQVEALLKAAASLNLQSSTQLNVLKDFDLQKSKEKKAPPSRLPPPIPDFPADGISIRSTGQYLEPTQPATTTASTGTQMEDDLSDTDSEVIEDDFKPVSSNLKKFGREGTKHAATNWFKETQTYNVLEPDQNKFSEWFHGIISRKESEKLLKDKILGCFLIRVSESRFGYTLSFKAETRCRHYMIDQLKNGKFIIIGEPKVHRSLHELVLYHKKKKLSNWDHLLTVPCGQNEGECDYQDLVREDLYFVLDEEKPEVPSRNYSVQNFRRPPVVSAMEPPPNLESRNRHSRNPANERRPLPKLPENTYTELLAEEDDRNKYKSLEKDGPNLKSKMSTTRGKLQ